MNKEKRLSQKAMALLKKTRSQYALCLWEGGEFLERAGTLGLNVYDKRKIGREINARLGMDEERKIKYGLLDEEPKIQEGRILRILHTKEEADFYYTELETQADPVKKYLEACIAGANYYHIGFLDKSKEMYKKGLNILIGPALKNEINYNSGQVISFLKTQLKKISEEQKKSDKQRFLRREVKLEPAFHDIYMFKSCLKAYRR